MLTKDNNKHLFKNPNFEKKEKKHEHIPIKVDKNIVDHRDCILQMEKLYEKIRNKEKNINKDKFISDDLLYIDFDIFQYESEYELKEKVIYYEKQIDILNTFFRDNNINNLTELKTKISSSNLVSNDYSYNYLFKKYDNMFEILENANIKFQSQNIKIKELSNKYNNINIRMKIIKDKVNKLPIGTILTLNGVKKVFKGKNENTIDKIKMVQEEFDEYCSQQINWAKHILGNKYSDDDIIKLLDIYNKLINVDQDSSSDENNTSKKYNKYYNNIKLKKIEEFKEYCNLGNDFIKDNINSKKDFSKEDLESIKEIIKNSDISYGKKDDKINRFINQCKRYYILSQKITNHNNIIRSKCKTYIRDINNKEFDNLLILLENKNENQ